MARRLKKRAENRLVDTALPKQAGKYADGKGPVALRNATGFAFLGV